MIETGSVIGHQSSTIVFPPAALAAHQARGDPA